MELIDFKKVLEEKAAWGAYDTAELLRGLQRVDVGSDQIVITLQLADLSGPERLALTERLTTELSGHLQRQVAVLIKQTKSVADRAPQARVGASAPFGLKMQTHAIPGVDKVVCVASGKGGVGKSTVAVNLALALRKVGYEVGLIDADLYGPSIPKMLGCEGIIPEVINGEMCPIDAYGLKIMSFASLSPGDAPLIWRGPMIGKALMQFFYQVNWGELDYLIIDLPPGTGDVQLTMIERLPLSGAVVVSSPQDLALIDAAKAVQMFRKLKVPIFGLIENMSTFICDNCGAEHHILGHGGAKAYALREQIPFLAEIPLNMAFRVAGDRGEPVAARPDHPLASGFEQAAQAIVER